MAQPKKENDLKMLRDLKEAATYEASRPNRKAATQKMFRPIKLRDLRVNET